MTEPVWHGWRALPRSGAVLVLLFGLLTMHALGGGLHTAHAAVPETAAATTTADNSARPHGARSAAATQIHGSETGPVSGPPGVQVKQHQGNAGADAIAACLAVLMSVMVLTVLRRLVHTLPRPGQGARPFWYRTSAPARGPPRDLLSQLCVLRT